MKQKSPDVPQPWSGRQTAYSQRAIRPAAGGVIVQTLASIYWVRKVPPDQAALRSQVIYFIFGAQAVSGATAGIAQLIMRFGETRGTPRRVLSGSLKLIPPAVKPAEKITENAPPFSP